MERDIERIKRGVSIVDVIGRDPHVKLRKKGSVWVGHCPFHDDKDPSMKVYEVGIFKCYACGAKGNVINYVARRKGLSFTEACDALDCEFDEAVAVRTKELIERKPDFECVVPVPVPFMPPSFMHYKLGMPKKVWEYRNKDGVLGYACRFEWYNEKKGKLVKDVLPYCVVSRNGWLGWEYRGFSVDGGTPLYGLWKLQQESNKGKTVVVVEGEKTADALQAVLPHVVVVSWMGGANRVDRADWSALRDWGAEVIGWPDNDWQGWAAMVHVSKMIGRDMRMIASPSDAPKGWDFADSGWNIAETRVWCNENMVRPKMDGGVYNFGEGGLVHSEFGWCLRKWENN